MRLRAILWGGATVLLAGAALAGEPPRRPPPDRLASDRPSERPHDWTGVYGGVQADIGTRRPAWREEPRSSWPSRDPGVPPRP